MVGIGRGDHRHIGEKPQERTVEFVGFDRQPGSVAQHQVAAEVLRYAAQESRTAARQRPVEPRYERRRGRLAVRARHGHHVLALGQMAQHLRALLDREPVFAEIAVLAVVLRHSRRIDHHRVARVEKRRRNGLHIVVVMHFGPFGLQLRGQPRRRAVVARHPLALVEKVARQGAHADAPDSQEIDFRELHTMPAIE